MLFWGYEDKDTLNGNKQYSPKQQPFEMKK